jgi:hypothetical protein
MDAHPGTSPAPRSYRRRRRREQPVTHAVPADELDVVACAARAAELVR